MRSKHAIIQFLGVTSLGFVCLAGAVGPARASSVHHAATAAAGPLVLYSAQGYDSAMSKAFGKVSGTQVLLTDDSTGNLLAKISAEKNNPHWDVVWFDGDATMQNLDNQGLLLKWTPANLKNYTALGRSLLPPDHSYFPTGVTAAGVIVYNTKHTTAAQAPKDWTDLLAPAYKDGVAENDPAFSGPAFPYISGQLLRQGGKNLAKGESYFLKLKANGLKIFQTNDPTLHSVITEARKVAIVQDSAYYAAAATGAPIGIVYPPSGVTTLPGVVAINLLSKHLQAAEAFVNYILSSAGQSVMLHDPNDSDVYYTPVITGMSPLPILHTSSVKYQNLDYKWAGTNATTIKTWFHNNIVQ